MKTSQFIMTGLLGMLLASSGLMAQNASTSNKPANAPDKVRRQFVDANKDGVCDNQAQWQGRGRRQQFADANNDGVCDNAANRKPNRQGYGRGQKGRNGEGRGQGPCNGQGRGMRGRGANQNNPQNVRPQ